MAKFILGVAAGMALCASAFWLLPTFTGARVHAPAQIQSQEACPTQCSQTTAAEAFKDVSIERAGRDAEALDADLATGSIRSATELHADDTKKTGFEFVHTSRDAAASDISNSGDLALPEGYTSVLEKDRSRPRNLASLHDEFAAEARDPAWADRAEALLARAFIRAAAERGVVIMDIGCRQTLCQIQSQGPDGAARGHWYHLVDHFRRQDHQFGYVIWDSAQRDGQTYTVTILERRAE